MLKKMKIILYYMLKPRLIRKLCCIAEVRLLHGGGSVCLENLGGSCLHGGGSWRPGVSSLVNQACPFFYGGCFHLRNENFNRYLFTEKDYYVKLKMFLFRVGFKPRSNRGTRVIHQQDWQTWTYKSKIRLSKFYKMFKIYRIWRYHLRVALKSTNPN